MTQELILIVLLSGFVGLVWVMTLAILDSDHPQAERHQPVEDCDDGQHHSDGLKRHTITV